MLSKSLENAINDQVTFEFYSSYTYLAMAAYCESIDLSGFANFFRVQAKEEIDHAMKFYDYVFQKGGTIILGEIDKPKDTYKDVVEVCETGLAHEELVTKKIYSIMDIAVAQKEHATISFLNWFVDEQVEEEDNFTTILKKVKRCVDNPHALYMIDDELAQRVYVAPANNA